MIADDTWSNRFFDRHKPMSGVILEEVLQKIHKSWQSQPIEAKTVLGPVSADQSVGTLKSGHEVGAVLLEASPRLPRLTATRVASPLYQVLVPAALQKFLDMVVEVALITKQRRWSPQWEWCPTRTHSADRLDPALTWRAFWLVWNPASDCWMSSGLKWWRFALASKMRRSAWQDVRRELDFLRDRVWDLPRQLGDETGHLRTRCSQGEENAELVGQSLERHLDWIRTLYDRVGSLEAQEARRVAARAPAQAPAQLPSEELVRMMANAFQQYSATQSDPQAQQPPPGDRA
ncbi:hypothetical protein PR001_g15221 [Phytophthora rubi]|uniref:Uncharacterized protein n=1 Tax=Phytophthora rubi TaxID=129364 RepID=A0A6A3KYU0_9STRA|nr:hypothetical protein PR002_g15787 [Phytophthora rubi]KAE9014125.1 hypothetical protein PR001_g15221 [Phytophthora rubi]